MKVEFETSMGRFLACKVPNSITEITKEKDSLNCNLCYTTDDWITESFIPIGKCKDFKIIGFVKDLTEEDWCGVVELTSSGLYKNYSVPNQEELGMIFLEHTATESGKSLMDSLGVYLENPMGIDVSEIMNYDRSLSSDELAEKYNEFEKQSGNWILIKYL